MIRRRTPIEPVNIRPELHCTVEEQQRLLSASPFFVALSPQGVLNIQRRFRQQHFEEGDSIQFVGQPADRLSIVAAGIVKMVRPTVDGQDVLLDFLGPGEHFGSLAELGDTRCREDVTAHTGCCILYTNAHDFRDLLKLYPVVALSTLELVSARLREAQSTIEGLSAYPVNHRVASTLLQLANKIGRPEGEGILIDMPLSRQDIADMTGATVETVSRVMRDLRRNGLIDSGRRWITVLDHDGLANVAGQNAV